MILLPITTPHLNINLHSLNGQILQLEAHLGKLYIQRNLLLSSSSTPAKGPPIPPACTLPPETLGYVFELACRDEQKPYGVITSDDTVVRLGLVCRQWRRVALGTPQLWTTIVLDGIALDPAAVMRNWLSRSGGLPVDVYFGCSLRNLGREPSHNTMQNVSACVRLLSEQFYRCRTLHVTMDAFLQALGYLFPHNVTRDASRLRDLRVSSSSRPPYSLRPQLRPLQLGSFNAPCLEHIDAWRPALLFDALLPLDCMHLRSLRWHACHELDDPASSLDALARVLSRCPNLEECKIVHPAHPSFATAASSSSKLPIVAPRLHTLTVQFMLRTDPTPLLSRLHAPSLCELKLEQISPISNVPGFGGALAAFLSRTHYSHSSDTDEARPLRTGPPLLRELELININFSPEDVPFLACLPHVERLVFHKCFLHDVFLEQLAPPDDIETVSPASLDALSPGLLPNLRTLTFAASMFAADVLAGVVKRRLKLEERSCLVSASEAVLSLNLIRCWVAGNVQSIKRVVETAGNAPRPGEARRVVLDVVELL